MILHLVNRFLDIPRF